MNRIKIENVFYQVGRVNWGANTANTDIISAVNELNGRISQKKSLSYILKNGSI